MIALESIPGGVLLPVRAQPRAKRNEIVGVHNGRLKVAVTAPPDKGRANHTPRICAHCLPVAGPVYNERRPPWRLVFTSKPDLRSQSLEELPMRTFIALAAGLSLAAGSLDAQESKPAPERTPAEVAAIAQVRESGGQVLDIAQNDPRLDVAFHLADGQITDAQLEPLAQMPSTLWLNLRGTEVTDAGLARIAALKSLEKLHLERTKVTDAGLEHLKGLENLKYLNLYGTAVTDAGIDHLTALKNLERLYVWETKVTEAGIEKIKQALPNVQVVPDPAAERRLAEIEKRRVEELKSEPVEAPRPAAPAPEKKE